MSSLNALHRTNRKGAYDTLKLTVNLIVGHTGKSAVGSLSMALLLKSSIKLIRQIRQKEERRLQAKSCLVERSPTSLLEKINGRINRSMRTGHHELEKALSHRQQKALRLNTKLVGNEDMGVAISIEIRRTKV